MIEKEQELLARVLNLFAQRFDKKAILSGGMVLRILGSPRFTNDLDYLFVPYKSKEDIVKDVVECLASIDRATIKTSLNSKCLRAVVSTSEATIQVEIKVAMEVKSATVSTKLFSTQFNIPQRLIRVLDYSVALANKMAAWNERRLIRDIYDIWFYLQMHIAPDLDVLEKRLKKPGYSPQVKPIDYFTGKTPSEFYNFLRSHVAKLTDNDIKQELVDYLPPEEITGLAMMFRAALAKLR
jgi:predicted nucleotidyltransferase component of viral defense system